MENTASIQTEWPLWRKIIFRFCFVYLALQISVWDWLENIPGQNHIPKMYGTLVDWAVNAGNSAIFHVRKVLVPLNGSGDTSYGWAQLWLFISIALIACGVWSILDRKRLNYTHINYWLCLFARYYIAIVAFTYGIVKIFGYQMHFPHLYELATSFGDFLPMHLFWNVTGYSTPYQAFSGFMEVLAGLLLLFRRTTTLGVIVATAVFINVMALNLSYDIPVKIFSMQLVFTCLFLLGNESNRIINFLILNKPADTCTLYHFNYSKKWMRVSRTIFKVIFILVALVIPFFYTWWSYIWSSPLITTPPKQIIKDGLYDVTEYSLNKHNQPILATDTLRWQDFILDEGTGSIKTADTAFSHTYNRAYFGYNIDTVKHTMAFSRGKRILFTMQYAQPDTATVKLWGKRGTDSLFVELKRSKHHFQLAERQFHWLSEHNR